ncbi:hypothetical protein MRB53_039162 [Persea americana]|nr:hypothetical protein MRB53_039162 [Persea americana]
MTSFARELGPAWTALSCIVLVVSLLLRTWTLLAFLTGALATLYLHPYEIQRSSRSARLADQKRLEAEINSEAPSNNLVKDSALSVALNSFLDNVIDYYIRWWYCPPNFAADTTFPAACRVSLSNAVERLYPSDLACRPIQTFMRQLISSTILERLLATITHKDALNLLIIDFFEASASPNHTTKTDLTNVLNKAAEDVDISAVDALSDTTDSPVVSQTTSNLAPAQATDVSTIPPEQELPPYAETMSPLPPSTPTRGRRLSFKNKSVSSLGEFRPRPDFDKKPSFLKRTSSLFSRSRSRSPSKRDSIAEFNGQSEFAVKQPEPVSLFLAEFCVMDACGGALPEDFSHFQFTVMISPVNERASLP